MNAAYHFSQLKKSYGKRTLLDNTELTLHSGQCIELRGKNGSGKSTLLKILAGLDKPEQAMINIAGYQQNWRKARKFLQRTIMYLHQQPYMFDGSVSYNLQYPIAHLPQEERQLKVQKAIDWAELQDLQFADANKLSGGEKQRVALARAWLHQPQVMLLDEPTANLDTASRVKTLQLLQTLRQQGIALMIASHDTNHFQQLFDSGYELREGRLHKLDAARLNNADNVTPLIKASA